MGPSQPVLGGAPSSRLPVMAADGRQGIPGDIPRANANSNSLNLAPTTTILPPGMLISGSSLPEVPPERIQKLERQITDDAANQTDPLIRSQSLERLALTQLRARDLKAAHESIEAAAESALSTPTTLRRDLRLMQLVSTVTDVAATQVIEGLSTTEEGTSASREDKLPNPLEKDRFASLNRAREEWKLAYRLSREIENINYEDEQISAVAFSEAQGSQSIARSGLRGSLMPLAADLPRAELLQLADDLLVEAGHEAAQIESPTWRDRALVEVSITASEAMQLARARALAASIPDPGSRSEALVKAAENLVLLSYQIESEAPRYLSDALDRFRTSVASARVSLETDLGLDRLNSLDEAEYSLGRKKTALDDLLQATITLDQRVELLTQLVHNAAVARKTAYSGPYSTVPLRRAEGLETELDRIIPRIQDLKNRLKSARLQIESSIPRIIADARGRGETKLLPEQDPFIEIAKNVPAADDPQWAEIDKNLEMLIEKTIQTARESLGPEATEVYNNACVAVSQMTDADPRSDSAEILIESLIRTNRFTDARAAVALLPDRFRHVEAGALATVDENQLRKAMTSPGR